MKRKNFYITTPIYYPSGKPHMGHAYSSILADVFARFKRNDNYKVHFLTGTDEHGLKIQKSAVANNLEPLTYCNKISSTIKDLAKKLNLSNDDFIRTTEKRHHNSVNDIWNRLVKSGDIYLSKYKGWYSVSDEAYYNSDEIIEKNGKKISTFSGSSVEWVEEDSFFFKLSAWQEKLLKFYDENDKFILPISRRNEVINFVKNGLKDLSVSRTSFTWGIKVPNNDKHIIYVWLDALTNYLSALNFPNTKDNLYKSRGNILDPIEIIKTYGIDELRYYLMKEVPHGSDGSVSLENLESCINSDLANNYGNLCQRVFSFIKNNCGNKVSKRKNISSSDKKLIDQTKDLTKQLRSEMDKQNLNNYIKSVVNISFLTNKYINDEEPWKLKRDNLEKMNTILHIALEQIAKISILLNPIIPNKTSKVLDALNISNNLRNLAFLDDKNLITDEIKINKFDILFKKTTQ